MRFSQQPTLRRRFALTISALAILLLATPSPAADGAALHDAQCQQCHGPEMYHREGRKVKDRAGLSAQVRRCTEALDVTWFDEEIEAVADYLNREHYHF